MSRSTLSTEVLAPSVTQTAEFSDFPKIPRRDAVALTGPVQLERRGTTSQITERQKASKNHELQGSLWKSGTLFKNSIAAKLREYGLGPVADELETCHSFTTVVRCDGCGTARSFRNRCDRFYCPECTPRLSRERRESVEWWTREITQPKHTILTLQNLPVLNKSAVQELKKALSRLLRTVLVKKITYWWTNTVTKEFVRIKHYREACGDWMTVTSYPWRGGFYSIEVTNEGKGWHLHLHALVDCRFINERALSLFWEKATRNYGRIVKVKDCRDRSYLAEVTKYAVKGSQLAEWTAPHIVQFIRAFTGVRQFGVFGSLYGKRSEFREWLDSIKTDSTACPCGCERVHYYSEVEWEIFQAQIIWNAPTIPPPSTSKQPELFNLEISSPSFDWPGRPSL